MNKLVGGHRCVVVGEAGEQFELTGRLARIVLLLCRIRREIEDQDKGSIEINFGGNRVTARTTKHWEG